MAGRKIQFKLGKNPVKQTQYFKLENCKNQVQIYRRYVLGFPTGKDSSTFLEKGTEVPSLSRDKGTMGQVQNLATGWDGPGQPVKI